MLLEQKVRNRCGSDLSSASLEPEPLSVLFLQHLTLSSLAAHATTLLSNHAVPTKHSRSQRL